MQSLTDSGVPDEARYIDRDFSWLAFNRRVLSEARNPENPVLERLKFLSIVANNLDEFFEVRVAGLLQKVESAVPLDGIARLDCRAKLAGLLRIVHAMVAQQYRCWNEELIPELKAKEIHVNGPADLDAKDIERLRLRFRREIYPLLTPIKVDPAHPFPWVINKALCLGHGWKRKARWRHLVFGAPGPVNLNRLMGLYQIAPPGELKFPPHVPRSLARSAGTGDMFARLRAGDLLLHHPFDAFDPVIDFLREAARDPDVLRIKQTLYRTSAESPYGGRIRRLQLSHLPFPGSGVPEPAGGPGQLPG